jgi:hexosaminidase
VSGPRALVCAAGVVLALAAGATAAPGAADRRPVTVPALQRFTPVAGRFVLRRDARVVVAPRDRRRLLGEGRTLARDLGTLRGRRAAVGTRARRGDVVLRRSRDPRLGAEGYRLHVARAFAISARRPAGAYYGGRTLLQLVRGGDPIPRGRGHDAPLYRERGLMLDNGRAFFSRRWLERRIAELGALKLNMLHLHLSDDQGFRIESRSHPEAVTPPALSRRDVRRLVAVAGRHHVTIVPEIDAPGHLTAALRAHPELQLADAGGARRPDKLDVTDPAARRFYLDLVDELAPLFPGPTWHLGADEYLGIASTAADYASYPQLEAYADARHGPRANGKDAVLDFVNAVGRRVRAQGKRLRVWSDGAGGGSAVRLDPRTSVEWWEERHSPSVEALVAAGHRVLNTGWWPNYYPTAPGFAAIRAPVRRLYEDYRPWEFTGPYTARWADPQAPPAGRLRRGDPRQLGGSLAVWNDVPTAPEAREQAVADAIAPRLRALGQRLWGSPDRFAGYRAFARRAARIAPGG